MMSFFVWDGETSLSKGLTVERCPAFGAGQRIVEKTTVPGKSGDLVFDTGAFSNYTQSYEIWFRDKSAGMTSAAKSIATWLLSPSGYQRLEDTYDPDVFRMAVYTGPMEIENWMLTYGRATLDFDCMPQRWLKSGEIPVSRKKWRCHFKSMAEGETPSYRKRERNAGNKRFCDSNQRNERAVFY